MKNRLSYLLTLTLIGLSQVGIAASKSDELHHASMLAMEKMNQQMHAVKPSGNVEVEFMQMMIPHHQSAIDMAQAYIRTGADAEVKGVAEKIIEDQTKEINDMRALIDKKLKVKKK